MSLSARPFLLLPQAWPSPWRHPTSAGTSAPGRSSYEGPAPAIEFTDTGNGNGNANANANANGSSDVAGALEPRQARTNSDVV